ncbi:MAG: hypothetical protein NC253_06040 [Ruminococcus sp.]|nr:hypothetical protein [Ruminococcus sp.]MCM1381935.1 hypothetical protein [Muribaculaceae bacterium]MCM1480628.1 hypothetical protein [Muribaculaceae bacterium]
MNNDMSSKEAFNIIQGLKKLGANDSQIVTFIEFIETSDPKLLDKIPNISGADSNAKELVGAV